MKSKALIRFALYSLIGIFMFFVPITLWGKQTIPLDHLVTFVLKIPKFTLIYPLILVFGGVILPFVTGSWKKSKIKMFFSFINLTAIPFLIFGLMNVGPQGLLEKDMIPFILHKVVVPVCTIVPIGSIFLALIVSYGLMEFVGVFMRPVMKPLFKTPGRSAVDAVASFVGSYSIALLITNRVYEEGKYTTKEACIIATGFSTVSATFMITVAKTLGFLENYWMTYFLVCVFVTFTVTALTTRLYPLSRKPNAYYNNIQGDVEQPVKSDKLKVALALAEETAQQAPGLIKNTITNMIDGIKLALNMAPSLMAIGTLGLILAKYTPVFDVLAYLFYPFTLLTKMDMPLISAKAVSMSIAEMFLPVVPVAQATFTTKFIIGVTCISEILFFSASIPCMLATKIPLKLKDYVIIWFERVTLTLLITAPLSYVLFDLLKW